MQPLLLAGGGHAHIEVLRRLRPGGRTAQPYILVNPSRWFVYSGMVPGLVAGHYALDDCRIDLAATCDAAGVTFVEATIVAIDLESRVAVLGDGRRLGFSTLSLAIGSTPALDGIEGASTHAVAVRPWTRFLDRWQGWLTDVRGGASTAGLAVVGGGAGGAEFAMAAAHQLRVSGRPDVAVTIITDGLVPSHGPAVRRRVSAGLARAGVRLLDGRRVQRVAPDHVVCDTGEVVPADLTVCATGAVGPAWLRETGLSTDDAGFVLVDACLRSVSHPFVFAGGDVATLVSDPVPKAGVFAVRQGPVLARNLSGVGADVPLARYRPQRWWLSLISLGARRAVASYGALAWEGAWVWRWKDAIDRRFVRGG
jgi:selenide,water dikinase